MADWGEGWACALCDETVEGSIIDHFRLIHPDKDAAPENWPDGSLVYFEDVDVTDI